MKAKGLLLYQQFNKGKTCKDSGPETGSENCLFKAGETEILLMRVVRKNTRSRIPDFYGDGFRVNSVDPNTRIRIFAGNDFSLLVRVEKKNNLDDTGCIYDEAYITLDGKVLAPGELNRFMYGPLQASTSEGERLRYVQKDLTSLGYKPGVIDGIFGSLTKEALKAYREAKNLPDDLSDSVLFEILAIDAFFKGTTELKRTGDAVWEPVARSDKRVQGFGASFPSRD